MSCGGKDDYVGIFLIDAVGVQMLHYNGIGSSGYTAWDRLYAKEKKSVESTRKECGVHSRLKEDKEKMPRRMPLKRETAAVKSIDITMIEFER